MRFLSHIIHLDIDFYVLDDYMQIKMRLAETKTGQKKLYIYLLACCVTSQTAAA